MASNAQGDLDRLFYEEDVHALFETQCHQDNESESDDDEDSDSTDELSRAIKEEGGFGSNSEDADEEREDNGEGKVAGPSHNLDQSAIPSSSTPLPPKLATKIIGAPTHVYKDSSCQGPEDVASNAPLPSGPEAAPPDPVAKPARGRKSKKQPRTLNLNGIPIRFDENGVEIGYKEAPPPENTYAWASDTPISEDDPYFTKGCQRRMVFLSDLVPEDRQYRVECSLNRAAGEVKILSAVDKAYDWNRTRRGVSGATDETLRDGKIPRHFVLEMGPPNGPNGDALRVAERLKALVEHFFFARLAKSHLTIEITIPFHGLGAQSYYEKYMDKIRAVMENERIRDRLTVHLDPESAQQYLDCSPKHFYPPDANHDATWSIKSRDSELVWTFVNQNRIESMPKGWVPSREEIAFAKQRWLSSQKLNDADKKNHVNQAIEQIQEFIRFVHHYEIWKTNGSLLPVPGATLFSVPTLSSTLAQQATLSAPGTSVHAAQAYSLRDENGTSLQRIASASSTTVPPSAPAPYSFTAPQQLNSFTSTFYRASYPTQVFRQPDLLLSSSYGSPYDHYPSVAYVGTAPEQQGHNTIMYQTGEHERCVHQANAQAWQQSRQQQQVPPVALLSALSASVAPPSSSGLIFRSDEADGNSPTASSLGKHMDNERVNEHIEKRSRR